MTARYATVEDVAARYEGVLTESQQHWVETLLGDAEQIMRESAPSMDARIASGVLDTATVVRIACTLVLSVVRNPSGFVSQTAGEFSYQYPSGTTGAGLRMRLSQADRRALTGITGRVNTIPAGDPALPRLTRPDPWRRYWEPEAGP